MKAPDKNSNRSKKRAKRNFLESRPNRRAALRLNASISGSERAGDPKAFRKPGSINHW